jgi:hypothetical protein
MRSADECERYAIENEAPWSDGGAMGPRAVLLAPTQPVAFCRNSSKGCARSAPIQRGRSGGEKDTLRRFPRGESISLVPEQIEDRGACIAHRRRQRPALQEAPIHGDQGGIGVDPGRWLPEHDRDL